MGSRPLVTRTLFNGNYDGQGHSIFGLHINRPNHWDCGLFGKTVGGAKIRNLSLLNGSVTGKGLVGGLIGIAVHTDVLNCSFEGNVTGSAKIVGGLIGQHNQCRTVRSFSRGLVNGPEEQTGGLVGLNTKRVRNHRFLFRIIGSR